LDNFSKVKAAYIERIDEEHCNARQEWLKMGSPGSLTPLQVAALEKVSLLVKKPFKLKKEGSAIIAEVIMPPQGVALITIDLA
jgi:xylan 1,4-beta-xylosidase